jgi:hypothetical protein
MENSTQFDLKDAIRQWRDSLAASPACRTEDLDQLESHLLDSVATLQTKGLSPREAFWVAKSRLGTNDELSCEFAKVNAGQIWFDRALWMLMGFLLLRSINALADGLSNLAAILLHGFGGQDHLLGPVCLIVSLGASAGMLLLVWRSGRQRNGVVSCVVHWMKCHPVTAAVGMFLIGPIDSALAFLTIRFLPMPIYNVVVPWRSLAAVLPAIIFPVAFGWLLVRTRPKGAIVQRP